MKYYIISSFSESGDVNKGCIDRWSKAELRQACPIIQGDQEIDGRGDSPHRPALRLRDG